MLTDSNTKTRAAEESANETSNVGSVGPVGPIWPVVVATIAASMPFVTATTTVAAIIARSWCGTGLVGPLPQLTVLIPAVLRVLDVITIVAPDIAPTTTSCIRALAVTLYRLW